MFHALCVFLLRRQLGRELLLLSHQAANLRVGVPSLCWRADGLDVLQRVAGFQNDAELGLHLLHLFAHALELLNTGSQLVQHIQPLGTNILGFDLGRGGAIGLTRLLKLGHSLQQTLDLFLELGLLHPRVLELFHQVEPLGLEDLGSGLGRPQLGAQLNPPGFDVLHSRVGGGQRVSHDLLSRGCLLGNHGPLSLLLLELLLEHLELGGFSAKARAPARCRCIGSRDLGWLHLARLAPLLHLAREEVLELGSNSRTRRRHVHRDGSCVSPVARGVVRARN